MSSCPKYTTGFDSHIFCEFKTGSTFGFGQKVAYPRQFFESMYEKAYIYIYNIKFNDTLCCQVKTNGYKSHSDG